jgi:hypothetical protein
MAVRKTSAFAPDVDTLARAAGLDKALNQFPEDVALAAQSAASARSAAGELESGRRGTVAANAGGTSNE